MGKRITVLLLALCLVFAVAGQGHAAKWVNSDLLLSAKQVKKNLNKSNWVVLDCRKLEDYAKGHIPGAISLGKQCKKGLRDYTSRLFTPAKYEKLFSKIGIGNDTHVVIYGEHVVSDTMKDTSVAFWILEYLGHNKVHVLNGGIDDWINAGYGLDNKPTIKPEKKFKAKVVASRLATTDEILAIAKGKKKGVQLIDARSEDEHKGKDIRALRGGHIPHTTALVPHKDTYEKSKDPATGEMVDNGFMTPGTVAGFYKGLDKNKRTIAYCQTGTRSTVTYLELRLMGFKDPANYDESWTVYANAHEDFPVEDEQWINFARIKKLEKKIKALEDSLKAQEEAAK